MVGTSAGAGACWALRMVGPVARFKIRAEAVTIRNGRLHNMEPPGGIGTEGLPGMYRVSDPVANLITTGDRGVHRGNATEKNGSASLDASCSFSHAWEQRLPDVKTLPTIEDHSKIL